MEYKLYGPYEHSDGNGRKNVIRVYEDGSRKTLTFARHLMELHLGRELLPTEHVDHIDNNPTNDVIENLQILTSEENNLKKNLMHKSKGWNHPRKGKFDEINHGTMYAWSKRKCTCDVCSLVKRKWNDERNLKRRKAK